MFKFEKFSIWQKSIAMTDLVYAVSRNFPDNERFGLTNQVRRAACSIPSNITEGPARADPDFARFVGYATGLLYEVVTQSFIARRQAFTSEDRFTEIYRSAGEIGRMSSALRETLESR